MPESPEIESTFEYHVLLSLSRGPLYGYAISQAVEEDSGGAVAPRAGSLYRIIGRLMQRGLVEEAPTPPADDESHPGHPRKYYALTPRGADAVRAQARRLMRSARLAQRRLGLVEGRDR